MSTQPQVHRLEAGQALPHPRRSGGPAVLTEGELLVQQPARWLAGTLVLPASVRLVAPAPLPADPSCSFVAARACTVVVPAPVPRFTLQRVMRFLADARLSLRPAA